MTYGIGELVLIDVARTIERVIAQTLLGDYATASMGDDPWWLSPKGEMLAYVPPSRVKNPSDGQRVYSDALDRWGVTLEVKRLNGERVSFKQPMPDDIVPRTVQWSGQQLLFWAYGGTAARLYRADTANGEIAELPVGDLETVQRGSPLLTLRDS